MIREANEGDCINIAALSLDVWLQTYALVNLESQFESEENGFKIERLYVQGHFQKRGTGLNLGLSM